MSGNFAMIVIIILGIGSLIALILLCTVGGANIEDVALFEMRARTKDEHQKQLLIDEYNRRHYKEK